MKLAFDIEIAKDFPVGDDWRAHRPLGITCAATFAEDGQPRTWCSMSDGRYARAMTREDARDLVSYLRSMASSGYEILTWNGLSFDFDVLAEESGWHAECADLAMHHVDMMFHVFCLRGHYLGLDKAAKGLNLPGKTEGMSGAKAPQMWADGRCAEVLQYVAQDVRTTLRVAQEAERLGMVQWTSNSGRLNIIDIDRWLTVEQALRLPLPDTSWMTNPPSRDQFTVWVGR